MVIKEWEFSVIFAVTVVCIVFVFIITWIVAYTTGNTHPTRSITKQKLVALGDTQNKESRSSGAFLFVVGAYSSGTETKLNYNWYSQNEDTGAITAHAGISEDSNTKVEIYYLKPGEQPCVEHVKIGSKTSTKDWVAPMNMKPNRDSDSEEIWRIHVAKNTIDTTKRLDLK